MAAKQGLTAQLSQAGEDAKRAVLSRTVGTSHNWFSNLNTVCTIKSAPPRSPDVLEMLSTKSGWLFKRNEQHVWQARWCCVVPHMFLYYFDAHNIGTGEGSGGPPIPPSTLPQPSSELQDEWNNAIRRDGLFKQHEKRGGFSLFQSSQSSSTPATVSEGADEHNPLHQQLPPTYPGSGDNTTPATTPAGTASSLPQPAGIIDLECYSTVHRSRFSPNVLELAGDDQVNPDLRAFYFCATSPGESDDWSDALLNGRHSALLDEVDAYKQVCDGFASQLQQLHGQVDSLQAQCETSQQQVYHLRSKREDERRKSWKFVQELLSEQQQPKNDAASLSEKPIRSLQSMREDFASLIDERQQTTTTQTDGAMAFVCEYAQALQDLASRMQSQQNELREQLQTAGKSDQVRLEQLEQRLQEMESTYREEKKEWVERLESMKADYQQSQKELADVQKELSHSKMQMTMYSSQQKNKTNLLNEHKRILKKEVIDLRSKLEDSQSQATSLQHVVDSSKLQLEQERQKAKLLERYVEKIESQVTVQQNMMEMMSMSGSVYGGPPGGGIPSGIALGNAHNNNGGKNHGVNACGVASSSVPTTASPTATGTASPSHQKHQSQAPAASQLAESVHTDDDGDILVPMADRQQYRQVIGGTPSSRRNLAAAMFDMDGDNKSHMSELTEDRTQRHFEAAYLNFNQQQHHIPPTAGASPRMMAMRKQFEVSPGIAASPRGGYHQHGGGPPTSVILEGATSPVSAKTTDNMYDNRPGRSPKHQLDTIHSSAVSLPPGPITPRMLQNKQQQQQSRGDARAASEFYHQQYPYQYSHQQKLSVAQRARLEADRSTTPVRVRVDDEKIQESLQNSSNASQGSGLWRRMEEAVLGPRPDDEDFSDDDDYVSSSSVHSTRVTDYTETTTGDDGNNVVESTKSRLLQHARQRLQEQQQQQQNPRRNRPPPRRRGDIASGSNDLSEEKKVPELSPVSFFVRERLVFRDIVT